MSGGGIHEGPRFKSQTGQLLLYLVSTEDLSFPLCVERNSWRN